MQKQFRKWFIAQHGQRETDLVDFTDSELADRVAAGELARAELDRRKLWDAREESALYAWQATTE